MQRLMMGADDTMMHVLTPHVASTVDSYMKQHIVPIEIARQKIREVMEE
jgi:hypothetical protein